MARGWSCCAAPRRTGDSWTFDEFGRDKRRVLQACDLGQSELYDLTEGLEKTSSTSFWNLSEIILAKKMNADCIFSSLNLFKLFFFLKITHFMITVFFVLFKKFTKALKI